MRERFVQFTIFALAIIVVLTLCFGCSKKGTSTPAGSIAQSDSGKLVSSIYQASTDVQYQQAIEKLISSGLSLGLIDINGKQVNSNVAKDAVSLSPISVATYAQMETGGNYRTIEYIVDFLADAEIKLDSTGALINLKDFLPDLQKYVQWSYKNPDDPSSVLGIVIASGQDMVVPDSPPVISGATKVAPLTSLLIMGDILLGTATEKPISAPLGGLVPYADAVGTTSTSSLDRIRGLITTIKSESILSTLLPQKAQNILAAFETCDRLSVRMWQMPVSAARVKNWVNDITANLSPAKTFTLEKNKTESVSIIGGISMISGTTGSPMETIEGIDTAYRFQLLSFEEPGIGVPLYDDADAILNGLTNAGVDDYSFTNDLGGHRLSAHSKGNAPFTLNAKSMINQETRTALLHASAQLTAPENLYEQAQQKLEEKIKNSWALLAATSALDTLPWAQIKETMQILNRDFQPTPWMCIVEFRPVEKTTTSTTTTKPRTSIPEIKIVSPKEGAILMEGEDLFFTITVNDQFGNLLTDTAFSNQLMWTLDGISYFSLSPKGGGEFQYSQKLVKGSYKFIVEFTHNFGVDVGLLKISDYVNIKVVPEQLSAMETLFKKKIWHLELRFDDPQIKPQSDYEMTFKEGGTFSYLNTSWVGKWSGDGSAIKIEFSYDYKSGPNMITRWELTGTMVLAADGDYRNAVLKGEFIKWNEWEKDKSLKLGSWTAD